MSTRRGRRRLTRPRPVRLAALAVLTVLGGVACGVPHDSSPRDIPPVEQVEIAQPGLPPSQNPDAVGPKVYFLSGATSEAERLQATSRAVPAVPSAVITELLKGLTVDERARRWRTAVPSDTRLRSAVLQSDGTLVVDLSNAFFEATGDAQIKAVAQIVFTARGIDGVERVLLLVDGERRDWPRGDGSLESDPLTEFAYPELNPTSQPDYPPIPPPVTAVGG